MVMWDCHVDYSDKGRYNMIIGRDILTALGFNLIFSRNIIESDDGTLKESTLPMVYLITYRMNLNI